MNLTIIIHTENKKKLQKVFEIINNNFDKSKVSLFLHSKNYLPWEDELIKNQITSFKEFNAFPTNKNVVSSIVEILLKSKEENVLVIDENITSTKIDKNNSTSLDYLYFPKKELLKLNLDTKYETLKWFIIDVLYQKFLSVGVKEDNCPDNIRFKNKVSNEYFYQKIIHIDGGLGDHIMSLPLLEKIGKDSYVCCKYPFVFDHIEVKGYIDWNDKYFGGYDRFVYEYGSSNNCKTIIDAFFEMYGIDRSPEDKLIFKGLKIIPNFISKNEKIALICTSAAKIQGLESNKDWKEIRWLKLVNELQKQNYFVIQVGSLGDNQIPNVNMKFLDKPITELAGLIDISSLWISVDTFFHHFASSIKPEVGICLTPFYNDHAKHPGVTYIEKDCGKNYYDRRWWMDLQQPERKECMELIQLDDVLNIIH